jgi:hypothetical protein
LRDGEVEPGALVERALHPDAPAVQLDELARDREPEPVPWWRRDADESTCANSRNTSSWCSGAMPIPVSPTSMRSGSPSAAAPAARTHTRPPPPPR